MGYANAPRHTIQEFYTAYRRFNCYNNLLLVWRKLELNMIKRSLLLSRRLGSSRNATSPTNGCLNQNHIPFPLFQGARNNERLHQ